MQRSTPSRKKSAAHSGVGLAFSTARHTMTVLRLLGLRAGRLAYEGKGEVTTGEAVYVEGPYKQRQRGKRP